MGDGKKLQEILKERNYPVTKLASDTGISVNTLYALIKRDSGISSSSLNKIADALQISVDELSTLLSQEENEKTLQEEQQYLLDPDAVFEDMQDIINKLNELSIQYKKKMEESHKLRSRIAYLTKQQEAILSEKENLQLNLRMVDNDIKNMALELDLIRQKLK